MLIQFMMGTAVNVQLVIMVMALPVTDATIAVQDAMVLPAINAHYALKLLTSLKMVPALPLEGTNVQLELS